MKAKEIDLDVRDASIEWQDTAAKRCTKCKQAKPLAAFGRESRERDGRRSQCRGCANAVVRKPRVTSCFAVPATAPNTAGVEFRNIPNAPGYMIGSDGSAWSCWASAGRSWVMSNQWRKLAPCVRKHDGRKRFLVHGADGKPRRAYASHFVLEAFVGPKSDGMQACHNDGDCTNDALGNLRWDTPSANYADLVRHGSQKGERASRAKLTESSVAEIRRLRQSGVPLTEIASRFRVSISLVSKIFLNKVWTHVA